MCVLCAYWGYTVYILFNIDASYIQCLSTLLIIVNSTARGGLGLGLGLGWQPVISLSSVSTHTVHTQYTARHLVIYCAIAVLVLCLCCASAYASAVLVLR
jgi:hypothetical protein